jgi:hypothetical protein
MLKDTPSKTARKVALNIVTLCLSPGRDGCRSSSEASLRWLS